MRSKRQLGFTLIELVIVILITSFGLLGLTSLFSNASSSLTTNETLQRATQYAQECAEKVIATRRDDPLGFDATSLATAAPSNICNTVDDAPAGLLPALATGFARTVVVGSTYSGDVANTAPCPSGTDNCRDVTVTVTNSALSNTVITLLLIKY